MAYFAVTIVWGPGWDHARPIREQTDWDEHAAFMDDLVGAGTVVIGGPIGDGERVLLLVHAADEPQVRARLGADPWVPELRQISTVEPWALWLDGRPATG